MLPTLNCGVDGEEATPVGLNGEPNPVAPTCLTGEEFLDKAPKLGRGSLSQSLVNTFCSLTAEVNFPLRISSTKFFSTSVLHI